MPAPKPDTVEIFAKAADFRAWLKSHHADADELWVGRYKKGVAKVSMTYAESVEEALCYGWIDGIARRIDDEVVAQRFTPRRATSSWSAVNIAKVAELERTGRMHPAGLRAFEERDKRKDAIYSYEQAKHTELPAEAITRLQQDGGAWDFWQAQTPGYRRIATHWVLSAKRAETRERRLQTLVEDCATGLLIKSQRYGRRS